MDNLHYNKEQLWFTQTKKGLPFLLKRLLRYLVLASLLALVYYFLFALFINTSEEEALQRQNEILRQEYSRSLEKLEILEKALESLQERDREIYISIFKSTPPEMEAYLGSTPFLSLDSASTKELVDATHTKANFVTFLVNEMDKRLFDIYETMAQHEDLESIPSRLPLTTFNISQTGAGVGIKVHPFYKTKYHHTGIDLVATPGSEVVVTANGTVTKVVRSDRGRGNQITVDHGGCYSTYYAHLGEILVRRGQKVKGGQVIARVGSSGLSFAPHLHYEVHFNGESVDPLSYFFGQLSPRDYREMLILALNSGQSLD